MKYKDFSFVMFDLDGTLVDSAPDLAWAVNEMLNELGLPRAELARVREWVGDGADVLVKRALAGDVQGDLPGRVDGALFDAAIPRFYQFYQRANGRYCQAYGAVHSTLKQLCDQLPLIVVTNKAARFTQPLLAHLALDGFFQGVVAGDDLPRKKPYPDQLLDVSDRLCIPITKGLMVGDSKNDIDAARAAGCAVACVSYGYHHGRPLNEYHPDLVVDSLSALI